MRRSTLALSAALLAVSGGLAACGGSDDSAADPGTTTSSSSSSSSYAPGTARCGYVTDQSKPGGVDLPPTTALASGPVSITMATNSGDVGATLDADNAPCTVSSFLSLTDQGYFDNTPCHRLVTSGIFVLQCGDPTGQGTGGPGYTIPDELSGKETYGPGTLAMANTGIADSGGSQFFIVYANSPLPPSYTVFGQIDDAGLAVVKAIAKAGTADGSTDGAPKNTVTLTSVTVG